jgi:hypothetical protein
MIAAHVPAGELAAQRDEPLAGLLHAAPPRDRISIKSSLGWNDQK